MVLLILLETDFLEGMPATRVQAFKHVAITSCKELLRFIALFVLAVCLRVVEAIAWIAECKLQTVVYLTGACTGVLQGFKIAAGSLVKKRSLTVLSLDRLLWGAPSETVQCNVRQNPSLLLHADKEELTTIEQLSSNPHSNPATPKLSELGKRYSTSTTSSDAGTFDRSTCLALAQWSSIVQIQRKLDGTLTGLAALHGQKQWSPGKRLFLGKKPAMLNEIKSHPIESLDCTD